jgi:hypothetical protein
MACLRNHLHFHRISDDFVRHAGNPLFHGEYPIWQEVALWQ